MSRYFQSTSSSPLPQEECPGAEGLSVLPVKVEEGRESGVRYPVVVYLAVYEIVRAS